VFGAERLNDVRVSCLVIANHNMHLDQALLVKSLPRTFRKRLAIAAAASDIYGNRVRGFVASVLGNGFPFNKQGSGVRESLETVAQMLEDGWHVLIFPEGKLTELGPMQPFKSGAGLLAVETGAPVVPMRIDVLRRGVREGGWLPIPRGKVEVHIGPVVEFPPGIDYAEATRLLETAVREA
jgi:1-acyl-sn-glycerol-3-phosphate acyltransferase